MPYTKFPRSGKVVLSAYLSLLEYGEKQCASAFWNGELESELREPGRLDFFGLMKKNEDREKVMEEVDKICAKGVYSHSSDDCSDACKARGKNFNWHVHSQSPGLLIVAGNQLLLAATAVKMHAGCGKIF